MRGLYPVEVVREAENAVMMRVPDGSLMQRAARAIAVECVRRVRERRGRLVGARVVLLVGSGNNGGDALFAGAHLAHRGLSVGAICVGSSCHDAGASAFTAAGGRLVSCDLDPSSLEEECARADLVVDGIVGIGSRGALRDAAAGAVETANSSGAVRLAVDLPSGVDADTGDVEGVAFDADVTVTLGCYKPGLFLVPGRAHVGVVLLVDIGLEPELPEPGYRLIDPADVAELVKKPNENDHKYRRGVVAVAAGSRVYPGAATLTVGGTRYSGVGMVRFLDRADGVAEQVVSIYPDVVCDGSDLRSDARVRAWACGPGFTESDAPTVQMVLSSDVPVVVDAGALRLLATDSELRTECRRRAERGCTTVITPHSGEFALLAGGDSDAMTPQHLARELGVIVLRKGPGTTITAPSGPSFIDTTGVPDLACAGSGDVLSGLTAGMLAACPDQDPLVVVTAAVWLHGVAAQCAGRRQRPVVATDVGDCLAEAIAAVRSGNLEGLRV